MSNWWERSPNVGNSNNFYNVNTTGNPNNNNNANNALGVCLGFYNVPTDWPDPVAERRKLCHFYRRRDKPSARSCGKFA